jgi:hypothetical protein
MQIRGDARHHFKSRGWVFLADRDGVTVPRGDDAFAADILDIQKVIVRTI